MLPRDHLAAYSTATRVQPRAAAGEDRAAVISLPAGLALVAADGAGGIGGGAAAAEAVVEGIRRFALSWPTGSVPGALHWRACLAELDERLARRASEPGECAVVVAGIDQTSGTVSGSSAGDCEAWLVAPEGDCDILTEHQRRKPLVGSGAALPVAFGPSKLADATLLLGSDGLFSYAPMPRLCQLAAGSDIDIAAGALLRAVRLPSGDWCDDVSVLLCRKAR